jgi:hypothetical protein
MPQPPATGLTTGTRCKCETVSSKGTLIDAAGQRRSGYHSSCYLSGLCRMHQAFKPQKLKVIEILPPGRRTQGLRLSTGLASALRGEGQLWSRVHPRLLLRHKHLAPVEILIHRSGEGFTKSSRTGEGMETGLSRCRIPIGFELTRSVLTKINVDLTGLAIRMYELRRPNVPARDQFRRSKGTAEMTGLTFSIKMRSLTWYFDTIGRN